MENHTPHPHALRLAGPIQPAEIAALQVVGSLAEGPRARILLAQTVSANGGRLLRALKCVPRAGGAGAPNLGALIRDARALCALTHPNLVTTHEWLLDERQHVIATDCVVGWTLTELLEHVRHTGRELPVSVALEVVDGVLAALVYTHEQRGPDRSAKPRVHGALTPDEVLVSRTGVPRLANFGVASAARLLGMRGSPDAPYADPGRPAGALPGPADDLYATARILLELLGCNEAADRSPDPDVLLARDPITVAGEPALSAVLSRALNVERAARYLDARSFRATLAAIELLREPLGPSLLGWLEGEVRAGLSRPRIPEPESPVEVGEPAPRFLSLGTAHVLASRWVELTALEGDRGELSPPAPQEWSLPSQTPPWEQETPDLPPRFSGAGQPTISARALRPPGQRPSEFVDSVPLLATGKTFWTGLFTGALRAPRPAPVPRRERTPAERERDAILVLVSVAGVAALLSVLAGLLFGAQ